MQIITIFKVGGRAPWMPYRIDFQDHDQDHDRTVYLLNDLLNDVLAYQAMRDDTENALILLDPTNVSALDYVCEEAKKMLKQVHTDIGAQQESEYSTPLSRAQDRSKIYPESLYWYNRLTFELALAGHGIYSGGIRGDTSMMTSTLAYLNEHREEHQQTKEDTVQETTEKIKDALEKARAKINVERDSKESHLSEPWKDFAIDAKDLKPSIFILGTEGQQASVAILDTGCNSGNWIKYRLVHDLGKESEIGPCLDTSQVSDANGQRLEKCGIISLSFRLVEGFTFHEANFFVAHPNHDACDSWNFILGHQFLIENRWILLNKRVMLPLIAHKKMTSNEKRKIAIEEEKQRREKAGIEFRRLAAQQAQKQSKHQQSRLQSGQSRT